MTGEVILLNGLGIVASDLVEPGTVAIMLHGGDVQVVPVRELRATVGQIGSEKIEGLSMAPSDFTQVQAVIERRKADGDDDSEDTKE
ncbi:hypothetical protein AB4037_05585 [Labrys sp. KB_33_2]|uniref:hypothetical protein n=1 Tax=unclassified Labrys (in: a-proteobacteria) TaxID=2688601 RepID=UPI003EBA61FF